MAEKDDSPAANAAVVEEEPGPNLDDLASWAVNVSKGTGQPDVEIPDPTEKLPDPAEKAVEKVADAPAAKTEADKTAEQDAAQATEGRKVLKAKDGVHEIPYSRHEEVMSARDKAMAEAAEAKKLAEETAKQLAEAQEKLAALEKGADTGKTTAAVASQSADELEAQIKAIEDGAEALREEAPWMADQQLVQAKTMRALLAGMRQVQNDLAAEKASKVEAEKKQQESQQEAQQRAIGEALDATPALRYWQTDKPAFFNAAVDIDNKLKDDPAWVGKPLQDRFAEVVKQMVAEYGESILPAGSKPAPVIAKKEPKPLPKDDAAAGVHSLTDLPGGAPTAQTPMQAVEGADPSAIAQELLTKDLKPEDIIRWATA